MVVPRFTLDEEITYARINVCRVWLHIMLAFVPKDVAGRYNNNQYITLEASQLIKTQFTIQNRKSAKVETIV
jgi:hypothetical protein